MKISALLITGVDRIILGETEIPLPGPGEVLIESELTGISPGTELRVLAGRQRRAPAWPLIPGYSVYGRVQAVGDGVEMAVGTNVLCPGTRHAAHNLCWGAHASHVVVPAEQIVPVPSHVPAEAAVLGKLIAIAYHGLRLSRPSLHERVAVIGLGPIGQFSAQLAVVCICFSASDTGRPT